MNFCYLNYVILGVVFLFLHGARGGKNFNYMTSADPVSIVHQQVRQMKTPDDHLVSTIKLLRPEVVYSLLKLKSLNSTCAKSIVQTLNDTFRHEKYALQIFDSWGKLSSGVLLGNLDWPGRYYQCLAVKNKDFNGKYYSLFYGKPPSPLSLGAGKGITIGSCFPDTCSAENIFSIFDFFLPKNSNSSFIVTESKKIEIDNSGYIAITICCILITIVIMSTTYEQFLEAKRKMIESNGFYQFDGNNELSTLQKILCSFSVIKNTRTLLDTTERKGEIRCLHGLRFLSITWVIMGHVFAFTISFYDNTVTFFNYGFNSFTFEAVINATYSVDSFFYIGGLLVCYLGLKEIQKSNGKINIPLMYLYRYVRLTPAYAFGILFTVALIPLIGDGPFWSGVAIPMKNTCAKYWWTNLLYINNLHPTGLLEECYAWGWYLANDFQFFIISPFIIILFYRWPKIGTGVVCSIICASVVITGAFSADSNQQPMLISMTKFIYDLLHPNNKLETSVESSPPAPVSPYIADLYTKPWCRIGAYMVGMLTGYIIFTYKKNPFHKLLAIFGWVIAVAMNLSIVYGLYGYVHNGTTLSIGLAAFYNAVTRPCWCIGLAWLTISCVNDQSGPINKILSWDVFVPLSRLTYCIYLVHPLVIMYFPGILEVRFHFSIQAILQLYLTVVVISIGVAYILSMTVEAPVTALMKVLIAPKPRPSESLINETESGDEQDFTENGQILS